MLKKILNAARNPDSLGERAINAGLWQVAARFTQFPLRLASNLILTRLLMPESFGLMAIITTLHVGLYLFTDIGIVQSVMRHPRGEEKRYLQVAWVVQLGRGVAIIAVLGLIGLLVMVLGPLLAKPGTVYADPVLPWLIWFSGIGLFAKASESTNILLAQRRMRQRLVVTAEIGGQVFAIAVMVSLAWSMQSVWALAIGAVAGDLLRALLSHLIFPGPRMAFAWDREQAAEMWSYGKWLIAASVGGFLMKYGDRLILGALIDKRTFGIYTIALVWIEVCTILMNRIGTATLVPMLSAVMRDTPEQLSRVLRRFIQVFDFSGIALFGMILILADIIFNYLYTETYSQGGYFARIAAFKILLDISMPIRQFHLANGNSQFYATGYLVGAVMSLVGCYGGFLIGGVEAAVLYGVVGGLANPAILCIDRDLHKVTNIYWEFTKIILIAVIAIATSLYI